MPLFFKRAAPQEQVEEKTEAAVNRTKKSWFGRITGILDRGKIDEDLWEELEEVLLGARSPNLRGLVVAADMMRSGVTPLQPDDRVDRAMELFVESGLPALPVVDATQGKKVLGIVKRADISNAYLRHLHGAPTPPAGETEQAP